jgi:hypothetical protein
MIYDIGSTIYGLGCKGGGLRGSERVSGLGCSGKGAGL